MTPVFIGGCGRSGTTFLGSMLGGTADCLCTPESQFKTELYDLLGGTTSTPEKVYERLVNNWRLRLWDVEIDKQQLVSLFKENRDKEHKTKSIMDLILKDYAQRNSKKDFEFWIDHTPVNLTRAKTLLKLYPDAKFIHIIRDGRAVAASVMPLCWGPNTIWEASLWWPRKIAYGLAAQNLIPENNFLTVRYEDLVESTEEQLKKICDFIGVVYNADMCKSDGLKVIKYTQKQHSLVGKGPDSSRINAWRNKLSEKEIRIFEAANRELLDYLGYKALNGGTIPNVSTKEFVYYNLKELFLTLINKIKFKQRQKKYT